MLDANPTLPQDGHVVGMGQRSLSLANVSFPLLTAIPCVGSRSSHVSTLMCLSWCNVHGVGLVKD